MGTIRNRIVIVHDWNFDRITKTREDAIKTFQQVVDSYRLIDFDAKSNMVSNIMTGFSNAEYTFVINGECSKLGWEESDHFQRVREEWCEAHRHLAYRILTVDFGEGDNPASVREYKEEDEN